jgi:Fur family ferric uptake transcriptional regulator
MKTQQKDFDAVLSSVASMVPRMTPSIRAILSVLYAASSPMPVSDILGNLASRKVAIDKVTVYRKLELFLSLGVIQEVLLSGEKKYYELASKHHHHLVCLSCDRVTDWIPDESVLKREERRLERSGFHVEYHSLEFFGVCKQCG